MLQFSTWWKVRCIVVNTLPPAYSMLGSAIDALPHMHKLLDSRPDGFDSIEEAVEWQYVLSLYCLSPAELRFYYS